MEVSARRAGFLLLVLAALAACSGGRATVQTGPAATQGSGGVNRPEHFDKPHVVLISLDGFRHDYLDTRALPNLRRLMQRGARAKAMIPVFPSLTFPNHYSLVTGLYPEHHGIVANTFYDPARRQTYALGNRDAVSDGSWYRGEPIWVTAETQGMVAACFFWPGSEAPINNVRPTMWKVYDASIPNADRVKTVLEWLRLPAEKRPHLITLYFSDVDSASHAGTLDSRRVDDALRAVDASIGMLVDGIDALPIRSQVYVLVTSDHGMVETTARQTVRLDSLVDMDEIEQSFGGPVAMLHVRGGEPARASRVRDAINARLHHGRAYLRHEVPEPHRFRDDRRIVDVVIIMEEAWTIVLMPRLVEAASRIVRPDRWGAHGWDPAFATMHAIFIASGPGIRAGATIPLVNNVDVYPLMTELLRLRPAPGIDGKPGLRESLMR